MVFVSMHRNVCQLSHLFSVSSLVVCVELSEHTQQVVKKDSVQGYKKHYSTSQR